MYVLNANIRIGDIILLDSNSLPATVIKLQANGDYSHAAIVISESQAIEAMGGSGVQISSLLRFQVDDISNLAVYRANDIEQDKFTQLIHKAIEHQAKNYDLAGALKSIFRFSQTEESKFFCSELVAHLYNEMGIQLFDKESAQVKPNDFTKCDKLTDVSHETISELLPHIKQRFEKKPYMWRPLDNKHSSASPDALRHQNFLNDAKKVFEKRELDIPKNMHEIVEIITRPRADGNIYLDRDLSNDLMKLHNKHRILEELEADIDQALENDLEDYIHEIDELGVQTAIEELLFYEGYLFYFRQKIEKKAEEVLMINTVADLFPLNIIKVRAAYINMIVFRLMHGVEKNIESTINALREYITIHEN